MNDTDPVIRYVGYDKTTGQIVHTHSLFDVAENRHVEIPIAELKAQFSKDEWVVGRLRNQDPNHLDFIQVDLTTPPTVPMMVDPARRKLVPRPTLTLSTTKHELAGDGKDSADIEISAVDAHGKVIDSSAGAIKVTTNRGKLSARGGVAHLVKGRGKVTLTSVNETVSKVRVTAASVDHSFGTAHLDLEFV